MLFSEKTRIDNPVVLNNRIHYWVSSWYVLQEKERRQEALNGEPDCSGSYQMKCTRQGEVGDQQQDCCKQNSQQWRKEKK
jgi:hypothetical protein